MKSLRGQPGIFYNRSAEDTVADLEVTDLSLHFGGVQALNHVDLTVKTGELVAVIGPNGAGKTSLLNCLTGFYRPQAGHIRFNGRDITHLPPHALVGLGIGRTFQNIELFPGMTVLSNMLLARHIHCHYSLGWAVVFFALGAQRGNPPSTKFSRRSSIFSKCRPSGKKTWGLCPMAS